MTSLAKCITLLVGFSLSFTTFAEQITTQTPKNNTPEEVIKYVERGADLILRIGEEKAFPILTDPEGVWADDQWYLFIDSFDGYVLAHPNKKIIGKTLHHIRDIKGNAFFAAIQRIGQSKKGRGWTKYWWPRSGSMEPELKASFVLRVPGKRMWIGAGMYGLSEEEVDRLIGEQNEREDD